MIQYVAAHARRDRREPITFWLSRLRKEPGMRYHNSIFASLLKPISRRQLAASVDSHGGNAYDKVFKTWDHLVALVFAQLGGVDSLRELEAVWNANSHHHYHLGVGKLARSTLSDANGRRPLAIFAETFERLSGLADRVLKREGAQMLRLIDATPIPLDDLVTWADWNGRTRGLKLHVVYDPAADHPRRLAITPANVNDVSVGQEVAIEAGATYVFDKAYCNYAWWTRLHDGKACFLTRKKQNARLKVTRWRPLRKRAGDGFTVIDDAEVKLDTQGHSRLSIPLRRIRVKRDNGSKLILITNDLKRSAVELAALYKMRWQIELLFRWIKQHLKLRKFLGRSENAIRLQLMAAMIAYLLLRIAARQSRAVMPAIRFAELVADGLFARKAIARIDKPPEVNPSTARPRCSPNQLQFCYA
jgi:FOG: Transposase and inactivated derivatives